MEDFYKQIKELIKKYSNENESYKNQLTDTGKKSVTCRKVKNKYRYYLYLGKGKEKYIRREDFGMAREIEQNKYLRKNIEANKRRLIALKKLISTFSETEKADIYYNLSEGMRSLVFPVFVPEKQFVLEWIGAHPSNHKQIETNLVARSGHDVRSKSELIIDNELLDNDFVFAYEAPLYFPGGQVFHPDFQILDVKNRRTIIWEHFGMMNDPSYVVGTLEKYNTYVQNGFIPGKNFIWTYENGNNLNMKSVEENIKFLKKGIEWGEHKVVNL